MRVFGAVAWFYPLVVLLVFGKLEDLEQLHPRRYVAFLRHVVASLGLFLVPFVTHDHLTDAAA